MKYPRTTSPQFDYVIYDLEGDALYDNVTRLWCAVLVDIPTQAVRGFRPEEMETFYRIIAHAKFVVGHNILDYDNRVLEKLHGIVIPEERSYDTLVASRLTWPDRPMGHSLGAWGRFLKCHKGDFNDFSKFSEEMFEYCLQDGVVSMALFNYLLKVLGMTWEELVEWRTGSWLNV
ncbi:DNA polymerase [Pseudomonas phage ZCPS1]|nr:DNA polymerase [Pseudomonas phage ZCPS1]